MDAAEVLRVLDALDARNLRVGIAGGWGIDALLGRVTRPHGDLDVGLDAGAIETAIAALAPLGYVVAVDQRPARLELHSATGRVDLHPIAWRADGEGLQTGFGGQTFHYPAGSLGAAGTINGRVVQCATPALQVAFHQGYEPRDHDQADMQAIADAFGLELQPPYSD